MEKVIEKWNQILDTVKKEHEISDISFDTWMRPLEVYAVEDNILYILAPFEQMALSYIQKKYYLLLHILLKDASMYQTKYLIFHAPF